MKLIPSCLPRLSRSSADKEREQPPPAASGTAGCGKGTDRQGRAGARPWGGSEAEERLPQATTGHAWDCGCSTVEEGGREGGRHEAGAAGGQVKHVFLFRFYAKCGKESVPQVRLRL